MKKTQCKPSFDKLENEVDLIKSLKRVCETISNGKMIEQNTENSAKVLHKLGLVYKNKSPDKFSLIRSAVLLNAAIIRKPSNVDDIRADLTQLHHNVLQLSKAKCNKGFDLDKFKQDIQIKIDMMRQKTDLFLKKLEVISIDISSEETHIQETQKIINIQSLQSKVTEQYTDIMKCVSDKCIEVMGKPPCRYAVAGMGSLARKEITPYSDFEHILVLEDEIIRKYLQNRKHYQDVLEYYRWFSVLFQIIIINLGETVIPSVNIPSLNNNANPKKDWFYDAYTPCGICFDGMKLHACKFPLGRKQRTKVKPWTTELIQPISEMVKYLDTDKDLKNGYHLSDVLATTCFVAGDQSVFDEFSNRVQVQMHKNCSTKAFQFKINQQLEKDFANFNTIEIVVNLQKQTSFDIKRVVYRSTTLFIAALGKMHSVYQSPCSSFDIINALKRKQLLNSEIAHQLAYAVSIACEIRLKIYSTKGQQDDMALITDYYDTNQKTVVSQLVKAVGEKSVLDYFKTALSLQAKLVRGSFILEEDPNLNISVSFNLALYKSAFLEWKKLIACQQIYILSWNTKSIIAIICFCLCEYEDALQMYKECFELSVSETDKLTSISGIIKCLSKLNRKDNEVFTSMTYMIENLPRELSMPDMFQAHLAYGRYILHIEREYKYALSTFIKLYNCVLRDEQQSYAIQTICNPQDKTAVLFFMGECLLRNGNVKQAIKKGKQLLELVTKGKCRIMACVADAYGFLGQCYYADQEYDEAKRNFEEALQILYEYADEEKDPSRMQIYEHHFALCLEKLYEKA